MHKEHTHAQVTHMHKELIHAQVIHTHKEHSHMHALTHAQTRKENTYKEHAGNTHRSMS